MNYLYNVLSLASILLGIAGSVKWKDINTTKKWGTVVAILAAIIFSAKSIKDSRDASRAREIGDESAVLESPGDFKDSTISVFEIGYSGSQFEAENGVIQLLPDLPRINARIHKGKLVIDFTVFDSIGNVIARLSESEWEIVDKKYDYNNDDNAFEVVTKGDRKVIFQCELVGVIAHISGLLLTKQGSGYYCYALSDKTGAIIAPYKNGHSLTPGGVIGDSIVPLFKYSRKLHYRDRADK